MPLDESRWTRERPVTRLGCPLYFNNPAASTLGSGRVMVLDEAQADNVLSHDRYNRYAAGMVRDGQYAVRRGPVTFPQCSDWYLLIPRYPYLSGPVPPVAVPLLLAVSAGVVSPELYEAKIGNEWSANQRRASAAQVEAGKEFSARTEREYWARQPGLLDLMAAEARKLGSGVFDFGSLWGSRVVVGVAVLVALGLFLRAKG